MNLARAEGLWWMQKARVAARVVDAEAKPLGTRKESAEVARR